MRITRETTVSVDELEVGDTIAFTLKDGWDMKAVAVKKESDGMIFQSITHLFDLYPMNIVSTTYGSYGTSYLRGVLNKEIIKIFPDEFRLIPFANGDYLRIPTTNELYGCKDSSGRWKPLKDNPHSILGCLSYGWLQNNIGEVGSYFACTGECGDEGDYTYCNQSVNNNVYPVFKLEM